MKHFEQLGMLLSKITITNPIKDWTRLRIWLAEDDQRQDILLSIRITSLDATKDYPVEIEIDLSESISLIEAECLIEKPYLFVEKVCRLVLKVLNHELQESFLFNSHYFKAPHPEYRR